MNPAISAALIGVAGAILLALLGAMWRLGTIRTVIEEKIGTMASDASLEALRESSTNSLEALRESSTNSLEALRESSKNSLEALRESSKNSLEALRESSKNSLEALRSENHADHVALGRRIDETNMRIDAVNGRIVDLHRDLSRALNLQGPGDGNDG